LPSPDVGDEGYDARDLVNTYKEAYAYPHCFRTRIREAATPRGFSFRLPSSLKVYDVRERPNTWLEDFYDTVTFAGATPNLACRILQLYLTGPARQWLTNFAERSTIDST
jgi:hypothetical protein